MWRATWNAHFHPLPCRCFRHHGAFGILASFVMADAGPLWAMASCACHAGAVFITPASAPLLGHGARLTARLPLGLRRSSYWVSPPASSLRARPQPSCGRPSSSMSRRRSARHRRSRHRLLWPVQCQPPLRRRQIRARFGDISLIIGSLMLATMGFADRPLTRLPPEHARFRPDRLRHRLRHSGDLRHDRQAYGGEPRPGFGHRVTGCRPAARYGAVVLRLDRDPAFDELRLRAMRRGHGHSAGLHPAVADAAEANHAPGSQTRLKLQAITGAACGNIRPTGMGRPRK